MSLSPIRSVLSEGAVFDAGGPGATYSVRSADPTASRRLGRTVVVNRSEPVNPAEEGGRGIAGNTQPQYSGRWILLL